MTNDSKIPSILDDDQGILSNLNIPAVLLGPAGKAISRLVGCAADIPAAFLEQLSQRIRDKTAGNIVISQALAKQVAKDATENPELMDRAMQSFSNDLLRKQYNREKIAIKALEDLSSSKVTKKPDSVDDDWMNAFVELSEKASSDLMQERWAKILADEIRSPGYFQKKTLQIVDILPKDVAARFETYAHSLVDGELIHQHSSSVSGTLFSDLMDFNNYGLIMYEHAYRSYEFPKSPNTELHYSIMHLSGHTIYLSKNSSDSIKISGHFLTPEGKQIAKMLDLGDLDVALIRTILENTDVEYAFEIAEGAVFSFNVNDLESHKNLIYKK